ncbi:ATP-dependent Clp protease proteolytic subunit [Flavobacterium sp. SUN046]|uniref:ATP-dependent Clp protease proteolytic subunit n=1 Tax=Flavobacterium sp. SUN046 TaxID=3002440 RepID=UPI002DBFCB11|nr:ATP-dependent Clp protease proteolytic subunit [Flavobacterium sp. SUN046]MEC4048758.1 ATP-dependent Clp protease proteolytic subunit [Flavobacterium sp. SUN046]
MIQGKIYITGEIDNTTLMDCIKQVKSQPQATEFLVVIDSVGGYVNDGEDVYNFLKNLNQPVSTFTRKAYSIASMIFMAGATRIIPAGAENAIMIHLPWMEAQGTHQAITDHLKQLKATEDKLVDFYSKAVEIDSNTIHSLLEKETYLNANQALEMGFCTMIEQPQLAVAKLHNNIEEKEQSLMNKLERKLDSILNMLSGKPKAELRLQDATGVEIVFPDLAANDTPALEDKANVDGKPADGEFTLPDGTLYTFAAGKVSDIETQANEDNEDVTEPVDAVSGDTTSTESTTEPVEPDEPDADDSLITELQSKVAELQSIIDQLMSAEQTENLLNVLQSSVEKQNELETKFQALAKQVGSDFQPQSKENKTSVKASQTTMSRAAQILNS